MTTYEIVRVGHSMSMRDAFPANSSFKIGGVITSALLLLLQSHRKKAKKLSQSSFPLSPSSYADAPIFYMEKRAYMMVMTTVITQMNVSFVSVRVLSWSPSHPSLPVVVVVHARHVNVVRPAKLLHILYFFPMPLEETSSSCRPQSWSQFVGHNVASAQLWRRKRKRKRRTKNGSLSNLNMKQNRRTRKKEG